MPYNVPNSNEWELFFMRSTALIMAQAISIANEQSSITGTDIANACTAIDTFWNQIV